MTNHNPLGCSLLEEKKNKLFILWTPSYYPRFGGLENSAREYALFIKKRGYQVKVITNKYPYNLPKNEVIDGIEVKRYLFLHNPLEYLKSKRFDLFFAWIIIKPLTLFRLMALFIKKKPVVVNVHFPDNQLLELVILNFFFRSNLVLSFHGDEVERLQKVKKNSFRYILYLRILKQSNYLTFCSNYLLKKFRTIFYDSNKSNFLVIANGINKKINSTSLIEQKKDYIFSAARFVSKKGLSMIFDIFNTRTLEKLEVAGGDIYEAEKISSNISTNINFLGVLDRTQIINKLKFAKLTIVPSIKEPYGIIVAEAICCGSPLVATNVGGIPEIIDSIRNKLDKYNQKIFDSWVVIVEPNKKSIEMGIDSIIANKNPINEYLVLVKSFRSQFLWDNKLKKLYSRIGNFD